MCGIAGIVAYRTGARPVNAQELCRVRDAMAARGPDAAGLWLSKDDRIGLAHRRLSIIDLSSEASQPMATPDGTIRIVFNGEIYNFESLRRQLEAAGHRFRTQSDTEVLLSMYEQFGQEMVHQLRGMYAFAIWDERRRGLFLARDPFGIKPLYYADDGATFRFASQVKALLRAGGIDTRPAPAGHVGYLLWGSVPDPHTLYKGIRAVPAGSTVWLQQNERPIIRSFWGLCTELERAHQASQETSRQDLVEALHDTLADSMRHHLQADVPVGVFLSSGIDSSVMLALASEAHQRPVKAITLGFREYQSTANDETALAARVAKHYEADHLAQWVTSTDFEHELTHLLEAMDQPTIDGVNAYFVSKVAAEAKLKVAISGLGGDELFQGYPGFRDIPRLVSSLAFTRQTPMLNTLFRQASSPLLSRFTSPKYAGVLEYGGNLPGAYMLRRALYMPWELPRLLGADFAAEGLQELQPLHSLEDTLPTVGSPQLKIAALELSWYLRHQLLRDADWAGMAHSLEIRVPMIDVEVFRRLAPLMFGPAAPSKWDLALVPTRPLPPVLLTRPKTGFVVPVREWLFAKVPPRYPEERGLRSWARRIYDYQITGTL